MAWWDVPAKLPDMYDIHSQDKRPWISFPVDKIDWRPANVEEYLAKVSNSTKEQLEGDKKIQEVFRKLEERFWESFDRKNFDIKSCWLTQEEIEIFWNEIFTLLNKQTERLVYINQDWETLLDMIDFKPFGSSLHKSLLNKAWTDYKQDEKWRWILIRKWKEYLQWTEVFNNFILLWYILKTP